MGKLKGWATAGVAMVGGVAAPVFAAVPEGVSNALTAASTDGATVAGLVIAAIVAIFAFTLMRKALR